MTIPFKIQGPTAILPYADDSTDTAVELVPGNSGLPNSLYVFNPDTANVVAVNYSFNALDHNASIPTSGFNGIGVVVGPNSAVQLAVDTT